MEPSQLSEKSLFEASLNGELQVLKNLVAELDELQDPARTVTDLRDYLGRSLLHFSAFGGRFQVCEYLVEQVKLDVNLQDEYGETPLHHAISGGKDDIAEYLVEKGADVNLVATSGTALHCAAEEGRKPLLLMLISKGAKVDVNSSRGTPLHLAASEGKKDSVEVLLENQANPNDSQLVASPLMVSAIAQSIECMNLLLKAGADPNVKGSGDSPLFAAAYKGNTEMIRMLLAAGADPNITNDCDMKPIEIAALRDHEVAVEMLFPKTSPIQSITDWSLTGVKQHVHSPEASLKRIQKYKENLLCSKSKGDEALGRKEYPEALHWYSTAICLDRLINSEFTDAEAFSKRSFCYACLKVGKNALEDAEVCVNLSPDCPEAHYREGVALTLLKDFEKAYAAFCTALELEPDNEELQRAVEDCATEIESRCASPVADCE